MLVRVLGATLNGIAGASVSVEVDAGRGLPAFHIVGQGDRVVSESRDRIRAAFRHCGLEFPPGRVTVNLAPSDLPKTGSTLDLPIALGIAATRTELPRERLATTLFLGELGLDGRLSGIRGTLALLSDVAGEDVPDAVVPLANLREASVCPDVRALGARDLGAAIDFARSGEGLDACAPPWDELMRASGDELDLGDVRGQETARRALEIAASGGHNLLLIGPPGSGKTLLARRLPGLLPDLPFPYALEATRVHSVAGTLGERPLLLRPPLRAPHHSTSDAGMIGGGRPLRPGEISLAHRGVLFLDELPEFRRPTLEALRQPLEEGRITVVRAHGASELPARFQLIAAMNPCPCGFRGDPSHECSCEEAAVRRYRAKLSGPLLDRIDLHVAVPALRWQDLDGTATVETSRRVRARVHAARELQARRYDGTAWTSNAELTLRGVRRHCPIASGGLGLLERAVDRLGLSGRAYVRVLRVARTIADLAAARRLESAHVAEAIGYRILDRGEDTAG